MRRLILVISLFGMSTAPLPAQRFFDDDPVWEDRDRRPVPPPTGRSLSQIVDFLNATFLERPDTTPRRAVNINTLGEVPDSSWFTNRMGRRILTIDELIRGPNQSDGPSTTGEWTIIDAKSEGVTPGFTIQDNRGEVYFIKFDPLRYPQMATSAEAIATHFFHAFGYHVPENFLVSLRPEILKIDPDTLIEYGFNKTRPMIQKDVDFIVSRAPLKPDGTIQVIASKRLEGEWLGAFSYFNTRQDDGNDVFPHEQRRELRGLRVFASWLNHDDTRAINTLDMFIRPAGDTSGPGHVRHHLIDFGSTFGSGSIKPQSRRAGNEYMLEWKPFLRSTLTLGVWDRKWRTLQYPDYPGIGRFEADFFRPEKWKPEYPNQAFERMLADDAFWAARIVSRFTDPMVRALVGVGQFLSRESEDYLVRCLLTRRDKIIRYYFGLVNPLAEFRLGGTGRHLEFDHLGEIHGLAGGSRYRYQIFAFDNDSDRATPLQDPRETETRSIPVTGQDQPWVKIQINTLHPEYPTWDKTISIYLRNQSGWKIIGIEREL